MNLFLRIEDLEANYRMVSVEKYGFFLCLHGWVRIMLGGNIIDISEKQLCIYTPNTFMQILERSDNLSGILVEEEMSILHSEISNIDVNMRIKIRNVPCVELDDNQIGRINDLINYTRDTLSMSEFDSILCRQRQILISAICLEILKDYFSNQPITVSTPNRYGVILNRFLVSVYTNCHHHRDVEYYASEQNLTPYYFSNIIKSQSGKSALQWIASITIMFVRQYLGNADLSIKEIAQKMNFPDQSTFGRYFKRYEKISPSEYRRRNLIN